MSLFASTTESIIKKEFDKEILPKIISDLDKNQESIVIFRVYKTNKSVTIKTYKVEKTFSKTLFLEEKGDYST